MTHCYLRAMSPIHLKCELRVQTVLLVPAPYLWTPMIDLANMGVRSSMSVVRMAAKLRSFLLFPGQLLNEMSIVDRRIRSTVGARCVPFVRTERNARFFPCPPDVQAHE
jgi:hypothetical protein